MKILITGQKGSIANHIRKSWTEKDLHFVSFRQDSFENKIFKGIDVIIHLAGITGSSNKYSRTDYMYVNCEKTVQFARQAKQSGVKHFIFISTLRVYGKPNQEGVWNENTPCNPVDDYGYSKREAELGLMKLSSESFTVCILRIPLVYGRETRGKFLKLLRIIDVMLILPFGGIANTRYYLHIDLLLQYLSKIVHQAAGGYLIAQDQDPISTSSLVKLFASRLKKKRVFFSLPKWFIRVLAGSKIAFLESFFGSYVLENRETLKQLSFSPVSSGNKGLEEMADWYVESKKKTSN